MSEIAQRSGLRRAGRLAALVLIGAAAGLSWRTAGFAADPGVFRVGGVRVAATAKTSAAAKTAAVAKGAATALDLLLRRLTLAADHGALPRLKGRSARALVRGIEVEAERRSDETYDATVAYRFDPAAVRALLTERNLRFVETTSRPVLILPIWRTAGTPVLWDDPNPWRRAWSRLPAVGGLVPIRTGRGGVADLQAIDGEQAVAGATRPLGEIARRYEAGSVLIAVAARRGRNLYITMRRYDPDSGSLGAVESLRTDASDEAMQKAAREIVARLERRWKRANLVVDTATSTIQTLVPMGSLAEWNQLRRRLGRVPLVKRFNVVRFATDVSVIHLIHVGNVDQLRTALKESGLILEREKGGGQDARWVLRPTREARAEPNKPPPAPPPPARPDRPN